MICLYVGPEPPRQEMFICVAHNQSLQTEADFPSVPAALAVLLGMGRKVRVRTPDMTGWLQVKSVKLFLHNAPGSNMKSARRYLIQGDPA